MITDYKQMRQLLFCLAVTGNMQLFKLSNLQKFSKTRLGDIKEVLVRTSLDILKD